MSDSLKKTGIDQAGFRPVNNQVALLLSNDDLIALNSPLAVKENKLDLVKPKKEPLITNSSGEQKLFKGEEAEKEEEERKKNNRTFTVASLSLELTEKFGAPEVGDEVSLLPGTMTELVVENKVYGVIPFHRVLAIHKVKIG